MVTRSGPSPSKPSASESEVALRATALAQSRRPYGNSGVALVGTVS